MRLYELRREETLRKARHFMVFEFQPKTLEQLRAVSRDVKAKRMCTGVRHSATGRWQPPLYARAVDD